MDEITKEDVDLFYQDAHLGNADAQFLLGLCYLNGEHVEEDPATAVFWFKEAAQQGNAEAQYFLSLCLEEGSGTAEDEDSPIYWLRKAAEQGHPDAQYDLAMRLSEGDGVEEDPVTAFEWFMKAAEQGHSDAQEIVATLEEQMAREQARRMVGNIQKSLDATGEPFEGALKDSSPEDLEKEREAMRQSFASANEAIAHFLKFGFHNELYCDSDAMNRLWGDS